MHIAGEQVLQWKEVPNVNLHNSLHQYYKQNVFVSDIIAVNMTFLVHAPLPDAHVRPLVS